MCSLHAFDLRCNSYQPWQCCNLAFCNASFQEPEALVPSLILVYCVPHKPCLGVLQMVGALKQLLQTDRNPLEANVYLEYASYAEYRVPENSLLEPLLTRLEAFQALWETNRR